MANKSHPLKKRPISFIKLVCSIIIIIVAGSSASAQLRFANIFSDNMVLEREKSVRGWAEPTAEVTVTISEDEDTVTPYIENEPTQNDDQYSVTVECAEQNAPKFDGQIHTVKANSKGYWQVELNKMPGDFTPKFLVVVSGGSGAAIKNILIGEVWVCSGQSNM